MSRIDRVAVIGAGTMGHGIAHVCALSGAGTVIHDPDSAQVRNALEKIERNLDAGVARGKVAPEARDAALRRLGTASSLEEAVEKADLVVEAIPERLEMKRDLFARLDRAAPMAAILATNTSSLSIDEIAAATRTPERVLGLHFFNPVHLMRLLEIVRGRGTSDETIARAMTFARAIGKEAILVADTPGFATSRLGVVLGLEAIRMVEQGVASVEDIDTAMALGYNHPVGPLRLTDMIGLDVRLEIARYLHATLGGEQYRPPHLLEHMVAEGRLGRKAGRGFYEWGEE